MTSMGGELNSGSDTRRFLRELAPFVLPVLFFAYMMGIDMRFPLNDPDLWWHLKTGERIVENAEIPDADPFAHTSPESLNEQQKMGLKANWLGQALYYLAYRAGGLNGVGFMRNLLVILPMVILYIWLMRNGAGLLTAFALVSLPTLFFVIHLFYSFERPQGFSFSLAILTVILLERIRRRSRAEGLDLSYVLLPALMALWANIHAGYVVGNIIITIYIASEALTAGLRRLGRAWGGEGVGHVFFAVCALAVVASFLNPNTYRIFYDYFTGLVSMFATDISRLIGGTGGGGWVREVVLEYKPLSYFYSRLGYNWLIIYWIFTVVLYVFLIIKYALRRSVDVAELLTVTAFVVFANTYARGLMFSLAVMPFYMAKTVIELTRAGRDARNVSRWAVASMLVLSLVMCAHVYSMTPSFLMPTHKARWVTPWYPTRAVEFLKKNSIQPPMYNYYTWGGFLIWSLYPEYKVFIDGRAIDDQASRTADAMLKAFPGWRRMFETYGINFIVIPVIFRESGNVIPLAVELVNDDRWRLVFIGNNSAVFVRAVPRNSDILRRFNLDKRLVYAEIVGVENIFLRTAPNHPVFNLAKADALLALGRYAEAKAILERFPAMSAHKLRKLKEMGY